MRSKKAPVKDYSNPPTPHLLKSIWVFAVGCVGGQGGALTCGYLLSVWLLRHRQGLLRRFEVKLLQSYKVFAIESDRKRRAL